MVKEIGWKTLETPVSQFIGGPQYQHLFKHDGVYSGEFWVCRLVVARGKKGENVALQVFVRDVYGGEVVGGDFVEKYYTNDADDYTDSGFWFTWKPEKESRYRMTMLLYYKGSGVPPIPTFYEEMFRVGDEQAEPTKIPIFEGGRKRFFTFSVDELFTLNSAVVKDYILAKDTIKELADAIIRDVDYPFFEDKPDDWHQYSAFREDTWSRQLTGDYWQVPAETLTIMRGDCEDSSLAFVSCAGAMGASSAEVYEAVGVVRDAETGRSLGGHAWAYVKWGDVFRLMESTLNEPPEEYPEVENIEEPFRFNNIIYDPEWIFNWEAFKELRDPKNPNKLIGKEFGEKTDENDESVEKYRAIHKAFGIETKIENAIRTKKKR